MVSPVQQAILTYTNTIMESHLSPAQALSCNRKRASIHLGEVCLGSNSVLLLLETELEVQLLEVSNINFFIVPFIYIR